MWHPTAKVIFMFRRIREHGQRLTGSGSAREKNRAVVAVARKLAVLLFLWKHGTDYLAALIRVGTPRFPSFTS